MRSDPLPASLFIKNRSKLVASLEPGSVAVVCSGERVKRSGDQYYPFRQQSDFFYLTGLHREGYVLFLAPDHPREEFREVLMMREPSEKERMWSGPGLSVAEVVHRSGITHIRGMEEMDELIGELLPASGTIYCNLPEYAGQQPGVRSSEWEVYHRFKSRYPHLNSARLSPLLTLFRMVKEPEEVEQIRKACSVTGSAFRKAISVIRPGCREFEVEAEIIAEFIRSGAEGHAFDPILACGQNALVLHYNQNRGRCPEGDLLLMDFGAEVGGYAADCSRTVPVSGRFNPRQRVLYDAVQEIFAKARDLMKPGVLLDELQQQVGALWQEAHIRLGLYTLEEATRQDPPGSLWKKYFMHGLSHSIGLDVHDPFDRNIPLRPGMVLSCEPAIYLPEEGLGIRLENVLLVTETGTEDLMAEIPMDAEEVEQLIQ